MIVSSVEFKEVIACFQWNNELVVIARCDVREMYFCFGNNYEFSEVIRHTQRITLTKCSFLFEQAHSFLEELRILTQNLWFYAVVAIYHAQTSNLSLVDVYLPLDALIRFPINSSLTVVIALFELIYFVVEHINLRLVEDFNLKIAVSFILVDIGLSLQQEQYVVTVHPELVDQLMWAEIEIS